IGGLLTDGLNKQGGPLPVASTKVAVTGPGVDEVERTSPLGRYAFALNPGRYVVRVIGSLAKRALPSHYAVALTHTVTDADFQLDAKDHVTIAVRPVGGETAGNATIVDGASEASVTTTIADPVGNRRPILVE